MYSFGNFSAFFFWFWFSKSMIQLIKKSPNTMQWRDLASYTFMLAGKIEILVNLHNTYVSPILIYNAI